ncbi:putative CDC2L2 protein [Clostridium baratii]|uniref:hypothetical protein n=1 Tax=Clostridium baratii TaxID=1561 RepID=UPI0006C050B5|nr:hypothetical protein [Clostridium baratii]CUO91367.1 putative CDC2L2 protein [Clostridium baratii]
MKRYRVEFKSKNSSFRVDCFEDKLEDWKALCKVDREETGEGKCYYREFPVSKNKRVYF